MSNSLRDQLMGLGFKPAPKPERPAHAKGGKPDNRQGGKPQGAQPQGAKPQGAKPQGGKPQAGDRRQDGRKPDNRKPGPRHGGKPQSREDIDLAKAYADRATFIHVEIWKDYQQQTANKAATDWLYRNDTLNAPWVFLIGSDGKVAARWDNIATQSEIEPLLQKLPVIGKG